MEQMVGRPQVNFGPFFALAVENSPVQRKPKGEPLCSNVRKKSLWLVHHWSNSDGMSYSFTKHAYD